MKSSQFTLKLLSCLYYYDGSLFGLLKNHFIKTDLLNHSSLKKDGFCFMLLLTSTNTFGGTLLHFVKKAK